MNDKENGTGSRREIEANQPLELVSLDGELTLRQYTEADAVEAFALIDRNRDHLSQFGDNTATKYLTLDAFQESILHPKNPKKLRFGIRNLEGTLVGSINLTPEKKDPKKAEVGYYLGSEVQGKGYATRAIETLTDFAFEQGNFEVLYGDVARRNIASERVLLMSGYVDYKALKDKTRFYAYKDYLRAKAEKTTRASGFLVYAAKDPKMSDLVVRSMEALGEAGFDQLFRIQMRFERPNNHEPENWHESRWWHFRDVLERIPAFHEASQKAHLSEQQSQDLLFTVLSASPYDFEREGISVLLLQRALDQVAQQNTELTKQDLRRIKTMVKLGGKDGIIDTYLYAFTLSQRIGLSVTDSTAIISHFSVDDVWVHPGYATSPFIDALQALKVSDVTPQSVKTIFRQIEQLPRQERGGAYQLLEHAVIFACPSRRVTPQELFDLYLAHGSQDETITDFLEKFIQDDSSHLLTTSKTEVIHPEEVKNKYFTPKQGRLEHASTPYRAQRSLKEGMGDLRELAVARGHLWEDVAEGFWTFDPESNTWYSFGGQTEVKRGSVRHIFRAYDISELSPKPYLFHIHPEEYEIMLTDPYAEFPSRELREHVHKFLASTPSRADYATVVELIKDAKVDMQKPRSFIVHALGTTEFTYPSDIEKIEKMAVESQSMRDRIVLNFPWNEIGENTDLSELTQILIGELNQILPEGFSIRLRN